MLPAANLLNLLERVAQGFEAVAAAEPGRVRVLDAGGTMDEVSAAIWKSVEPLLPKRA